MIENKIITVSDFIDFAERHNNVEITHVSDRKLVGHRKHCRSGRIESKCGVKEAVGVRVDAYGYDDLGNIVAFCKDGKIRQFIGG